jgi:hypothetical protein
VGTPLRSQDEEAGHPCKHALVTGSNRCWWHGGGGRSRKAGAPRGNANRQTHGKFSTAEIERRRVRAAKVREVKAVVRAAIAKAELYIRAVEAEQRSAARVAKKSKRRSGS